MAYSPTGRKLAWIVAAVAAVLVIVPLVFFSEAGAVIVIPLGVGVLLLAAALVYLQLSFWQEGDATQRPPRNTAASHTRQAEDARTGATRLYWPRLRRIWLNVDESRRLVEQRETEEDARERDREKTRLRLTEEEDILYIGEPSFWRYWPVALLSGIALATSVWRAPGTAVSFLSLFVGMAGLLFVSVCRARNKYYLTSFRVLVRKRRLWRKDGWLALRYEAIEQCDWHHGVFGAGLTFHANAGQTEFQGLARESAVAAIGVLREKLPAEVHTKYVPPSLPFRTVL